MCVCVCVCRGVNTTEISKIFASQKMQMNTNLVNLFSCQRFDPLSILNSVITTTYQTVN